VRGFGSGAGGSADNVTHAGQLCKSHMNCQYWMYNTLNGMVDMMWGMNDYISGLPTCDSACCTFPYKIQLSAGSSVPGSYPAWQSCRDACSLNPTICKYWNWDRFAKTCFFEYGSATYKSGSRLI
jgi:hypothetical protein